jgi:hypothetical protein
MDGSLDQPPIIIRQDRGKLFLGAFFSAVFAGINLLFIGSGESSSLFWSWVLVAMSGMGATLFGYFMVRPGSLTLGPSGITLWTGIRHFENAWEDFDKFFLCRFHFSVYPACHYSECYKRNPTLRGMTGNLGSFGKFWEISPQELVDLLNQGLARWRKPS